MASGTIRRHVSRTVEINNIHLHPHATYISVALAVVTCRLDTVSFVGLLGPSHLASPSAVVAAYLRQPLTQRREPQGSPWLAPPTFGILPRDAQRQQSLIKHQSKAARPPAKPFYPLPLLLGRYPSASLCPPRQTQWNLPTITARGRNIVQHHLPPFIPPFPPRPHYRHHESSLCPEPSSSPLA